MTEVEVAPKEDLSDVSLPVSEAEEKIQKASPEKHVENTNGVSKLESDIIRQVEYYFGDANLSRDKFLTEQTKKDDGWVTFETLLTFKRLAAMTTNVDVIINALQKSDEGLVEISEDKLKVRRHPDRPVPEFNEERRKEVSSRTAYAKGFPLDTELSDIIEFFNQFDKVNNIVLRKYLDKPTKSYKFKGSIFITFDTKEQLDDFIALEKVEFKEKELIRKTQQNYFIDKKNERNSKQRKSNKKEEPVFNLPKGAVIYFEGVSDTTTREQIKDAVEQLEIEVAYIEFSKGQKEGHIRMQAENSAKSLIDKVENQKIKINDVDVSLKLLTEEEEKTFLEKAIEHMKSKRTQSKQRNGGHNHHRKRRGNDRNGETKGKRARN